MASPCCYQNVASSVVRTKLPPSGVTVKLVSPTATVQTVFKADLAATLDATLDLDSVAVDLASKSGKEGPTLSATVRPNLSQFGVKLEVYPLKAGNFKISRSFCLCKLGSLDLSYASEGTKLTANYKGTGTVGPVSYTGLAEFPGSVYPGSASLALGFGAVKAKVAYTTKVPIAGSLFLVGKALSLGGSADFVGGQIAAPKLYAKYGAGTVTLSTIVALANAGKAAAVDIRAERKSDCSCGSRQLGAVLSYTNGTPTISVGAKCLSSATKRSIALELSTAGTALLTLGGNFAAGSYSGTVTWSDIKLDAAWLTPALSVDITLGKK